MSNITNKQVTDLLLNILKYSYFEAKTHKELECYIEGVIDSLENYVNKDDLMYIKAKRTLFEELKPKC